MHTAVNGIFSKNFSILGVQRTFYHCMFYRYLQFQTLYGLFSLRCSEYFLFLTGFEFGYNMDVNSMFGFTMEWDLEILSPVNSTPIYLQIFSTMLPV